MKYQQTLRKMKNSLLGTLMIAIWCSCSSPSNQQEESAEIPYGNLPAEGFNEANSDAKAIEIADQVMEAMGGRKAWDETRYLSWNFFGSRKHIWDKQTGLARVESLRSDLKIIVDVYADSLTGMVYKDGALFSNPDSLQKYLQYGKSAWINDAYWIIMPFKLKDSGVTLKYAREDTTNLGTKSDVLRLTFENVGDTPDNAYDVWVSREKNLVMQWAYYSKNDQDSANFVTPWDNYQSYGGILLADNRGRGKITEIEVLQEVPQNTFTSLD